MGKGLGRRAPLNMGGPEFLIAIDDDAYDDIASQLDRSAALFGELPVRVVRASELKYPHHDADLHLGRYRPTTSDCVKVLEHASGGRIDRFEQDLVTGAVYRGGRLVWPSAPAAVANHGGGALVLAGSDVALLFLQDGHIRITTIPTVLVVALQFDLRVGVASGLVPDDWVDRSRQMLAEPTPQKN